MKWVRFGLVPLLVLALASVSFAQATTDAKPATAKSAAAGKSPEDMAKQALAKWKGVLKLTPEQEPQFESVMTDSYHKMAEAKTAAAGDKAKMKASMETIMSDRDTELAKILTPDQMKIYHEKVAKMSAKAKEHMSKAEGTAK
jgi:Spy/CpxP family protein refolding chaperone